MTAYFTTSPARGGIDTNSGLTALLPWATIAKNQATVVASDNPQLDRGVLWREMFTVPASSLTLSPYGTGSDPHITAGELVSGWTAVPDNRMLSDVNTVGLWNLNGNTADSGPNARDLTTIAGTVTYTTAGAPFDQFAQFDGTTYATYPDTGDFFDFGVATSFTIEIWFCYTVAQTGVMVAKGVNGAVRYSVHVQSGTVRVTGFDGTTTFVVTGTINVQDGLIHHVAARFDWANTIDHKVSLFVDGVSDGTPVTLSGVVGFDNTQPFTVGGFSTGGNKFTGDIEQVRVSNIARASSTFPNYTGINVYQATVTTQPNQIWLDEYACLAGLKKDHSFTWAANVLKLHDDSGNPDSTGAVVEAAARANAIVCTTAKTGVTIRGIKVSCGNETVFGTITAFGGTDNWTIDGVTSTKSAGRGIDIFGSNTQIKPGTTVYNCNGHGLGLGGTTSTGIVVDGFLGYSNGFSSLTTTAIGTVIQNSTMHSDGWNTPLPAHAIYIFATAPSGGNGTIIRNNVFYDYPLGNDSALRVSGDNCVVSGNILYDCAVAVSIGDFETTSDGNSIHHNLFYRITSTAIYALGSKNMLVYHNTMAGTGGSNRGLYLGNGVLQHCSNVTVKNNIFAGNSSHVIVSNGEGTGFVSDYNLFDSDAGTKFIWNDIGYNFAGWKAANSQDAHSLVADPLFLNVAAADYRVQPGSPAIDAGVAIAGINDVYQGIAPDIGAFEVGQFVFPGFDVTDGTWLNEVGSNTDLYNSVNDPVVPNDNDYIQSAVSPSPDTVELKFTAPFTPAAGTVTLVVRHRTA